MRRRSIKGSNSKFWIEKDRYTEGDYSRSVVEQWDNEVGNEFVRKQKFKLKKIERPIYMWNVDGFFNKEKPIKYTAKINIYYQGHRERTEINMIGGQKWSVILRMLWLAHHNSEMMENGRSDDVKMFRRV